MTFDRTYGGQRVVATGHAIGPLRADYVPRWRGAPDGRSAGVEVDAAVRAALPYASVLAPPSRMRACSRTPAWHGAAGHAL